MVQKVYCDRCNIEIEDKIVQDLFHEFSKDMDALEEIYPRLVRVELCKDCREGYNKLVEQTNENIRNYIKERKSHNINKNKFSLFSKSQ